ncbi:MAG: hypothetical protein EXR58_06320 [Chloroflexi bacterium]|nr:hypothetical protein [Chloroflexota bacterium]
MPIIDADAHVIETERTWDFIDPSVARYRPVLVGQEGQPNNQLWMVDGKLRRRASLFREPQDRTGPRARNTEAPEEAREMADLGVRLHHMDQLGIDVQVLHNTIFIEAVADRREVDVAVTRGWNRWLADIWEKGNGRFRWSCVLPLTSMNDAVDEIRFAKEHGAVAVCMRSLEAGRTIPDPYFYPIYEEAQRLNMAIAIHIANGNPMVCDALRSPYDSGGGFSTFRALTAVACHAYILSKLPQQFPDLRWGFIEASAQWIPWVSHEAATRFASAGKPFPDNVFKEYRIYVTCQTDDDLPYIMQYAGEDNIVTGTDYGHQDPSSNIDCFSILRNRKDVDPEAVEKIFDDNPRALYGL